MYPIVCLIVAAVVSWLCYTLASQGMPLTALPAPVVRPPVLAAPFLPERRPEPPVAILEPVGAVWCEASKRWRDPVTKKYAKGPK